MLVDIALSAAFAMESLTGTSHLVQSRLPRSKNKSTTVDSRISSQGQHTQKLHSRETGQVGQATASIAQIVRVILSTESFTPSLRTNQIAQATANFAQIRPCL